MLLTVKTYLRIAQASSSAVPGSVLLVVKEKVVPYSFPGLPRGFSAPMHPHTHTIIVGTTNLDHLRKNVHAVIKGLLPLDTYAEAKRRLDAASVIPVSVAKQSCNVTGVLLLLI